MAPDHTLDEQEPKHQRRVRYKGTHPKNFKEKYKELQPEQYADDEACHGDVSRGRGCRHFYFELNNIVSNLGSQLNRAIPLIRQPKD